jgi:tetratricopeptide (TPR) repeat protein
MRLPSSLSPSKDGRKINLYTNHHYVFNDENSVEVTLIADPDCEPQQCGRSTLRGSITTYRIEGAKFSENHHNVNLIQQLRRGNHQDVLLRQTLTLPNGSKALYLVFKDGILPDERRTAVIWDQGGQTYELSLYYFDQSDKQQVLKLAHSMASEPPIQSIYNAQYYKEQGDTHYDQRSWPQAITAYAEALTLSPRYAAIYYNRGMAHHYNGQTQSAIADLRKAAQLYQEQGKYKDRQDALGMLSKLQS